MKNFVLVFMLFLAESAYSQETYHDFIFVLVTNKYGEKITDASVYYEGTKMTYSLSQNSYIINLKEDTAVKKVKRPLITVKHKDYLPFKYQVPDHSQIVLSTKEDGQYIMQGVPLPFTPHPECLMLINRFPQNNIKAIADSLGLIILNSYPYCGGKTVSGSSYGDTANNTFILGKRDRSFFPDSGCAELKYLRQINNGFVGPVRTVQNYTEKQPGYLDPSPRKIFSYWLFTNKLNVIIKPDADENTLELFLSENGLKVVERQSKLWWVVEADESVGMGIIELAKKISLSPLVDYVNHDFDALNCPG